MTPVTAATVERKLETLPDRPGVYLFKGARDEILYVGKSKRLRTRVRSYFRPAADLTPQKQLMVAQVRDLDFVVAETEAEALILEYELISAHDPPFNIIFRDDKTYPMVKLTRETWPRLVVTRRRLRDGGRYFGPYPDPAAVRLVVKALRSLVPLRTCTCPSERVRRDRACLNHGMGLCRGPCTGAVTTEEYGELVERVARYLKGDDGEILEALRGAMEAAAERLDFERAAVLRDQLRGFERLRTKQRVVGDPRRSEDVVAVARKGSRYCVQVLSVRGGRMTGQRKHFVEAPGSSTARILREFLAYTYLPADSPPRTILVSEEPADLELIAEGLRARAGEAVELRVPVAGQGHRLVGMALDNARMHLDAAGEDDALASLASHLGLAAPPRRIECFDVSISGGSDPVASMVLFVDGRPQTAGYRRFRITTVEGTDDFACMAEAVGRRYRRLVREGGPLPDLVVVDGGLGQVSAARGALAAVEGAGTLLVVGLAKREERVVGPGLGEGLLLPPRDPARRLLQRMRDEAHRRAVGHHRLLRDRRSLSSALDAIPGVGPRLRTALLRRFGDLDSIRSASTDELTTVRGVGPRLAALIKADLERDPC